MGEPSCHDMTIAKACAVRIAGPCPMPHPAPSSAIAGNDSQLWKEQWAPSAVLGLCSAVGPAGLCGLSHRDGVGAHLLLLVVREREGEGEEEGARAGVFSVSVGVRASVLAGRSNAAKPSAFSVARWEMTAWLWSSSTCWTTDAKSRS